ncbi:MAG: hypothetical protein J6C65_03810 [Prevotella sp.]|nr:hypothetical protein [Prevotella sp.]
METKNRKIYVKPEMTVIECEGQMLLNASQIEVTEDIYTSETGEYWGD